ncbi:MAG: hypothetical protein U5J99_01700 [Parvularculaceae bacterium]|nr:hypothetical protein [Parvularculaceae bacterium]
MLFDQGTPVPLRRLLAGCDVRTAFELGWSNLENGALLAAAEGADVDVFVTTDKNLKYQQKTVGRRIAIIVLSTTSWPRIEKNASGILTALIAATAGDFIEVEIA